MTVEERQRTERAALVNLALKMGWVTVKPAVPEALLFSGNNKRTIKTVTRPIAMSIRQRNRDRGLTSRGKARKNKLHAQLKGLSRQDYQREYMRLWRAKKIKNS